ncbi:MAG: ATP-binding cassette domain-containing protein [Bdellovibrionales bacterium]
MGFENSKLRTAVDRISLESVLLKDIKGQVCLVEPKFSFQAGKVYQLSGKLGFCSELMRMLALIKKPDEGELLINGESVFELTFNESIPYKLNIGYGFDTGGLINNKTIFENLMLPLEYHREITYDEACQVIDSYLELFSLSEYRDVRPALVPGFVRKLVCIIRSFIHQPEILILDGPTTAVDMDRSAILKREIKRQLDSGSLKFLIFSTSYEDGFRLWDPIKLSLFGESIVENNKKEAS